MNYSHLTKVNQVMGSHAILVIIANAGSATVKLFSIAVYAKVIERKTGY